MVDLSLSLTEKGSEEAMRKKVTPISWPDCRKSGHILHFDAEYDFDSGFAQQDMCKSVIPDADKYVYLLFCGQWYAINGRGARSWQVVTAENCYEWNAGSIKVVPLPEYEFPDINYHDAGRSRWQPGIFRDLVLIDNRLTLFDSACSMIHQLTEISNAVCMFGSLFFSTELPLFADELLERVLPYYFEGDMLERKWEEADRLSRGNVYSWNPFTGETSGSKVVYDHKKREKE